MDLQEDRSMAQQTLREERTVERQGMSQDENIMACLPTCCGL